MTPWLRLLLSPPWCPSQKRLQKVVQGKTVLITGASFGIGEACARQLAAAGARVLLLARTQEKLEALAAELTSQGSSAYAYPCNLYHPEKLPALIAQLEAEHSQIDIVLCNAGKSIRRRLTDSFGRDDLERAITLNFSAHATLIMGLLPRLLTQPQGAHILAISTVSARLPGIARWGTYQSSKAALDSWLQALHSELSPQGIHATSVYMPLVQTRMSGATDLWKGVPALSTDEAAQVVAHAIVRKKLRVAPWWLWHLELIALLFPGQWDRQISNWDRKRP